MQPDSLEEPEDFTSTVADLVRGKIKDPGTTAWIESDAMLPSYIEALNFLISDVDSQISLRQIEKDQKYAAYVRWCDELNTWLYKVRRFRASLVEKLHDATMRQLDPEQQITLIEAIAKHKAAIGEEEASSDDLALWKFLETTE